jgi:lipopolysaccharide/colanic/teichoic acid biosynthesis glycosyltransferase
MASLFYVKRCLGQNEREISVCKLRTMRVGADEEIGTILASGYDSYGKIIRDPRILSKFHGFLRTHWIDELPQLYNLVRGDLKLVGIRPMTRRTWERYPKEVINRALLQKPGLCGISYAFERTERAEDDVNQMVQYLDDYDRNPVECDREYFGRIVHNILRGARSS